MENQQVKDLTIVTELNPIELFENGGAKINNQIVADIMQCSGINEGKAKQIVTAMVKNQISNVSITY